MSMSLGMASRLNKSCKSLVVKKSEGSAYAYDAHLTERPIPTLTAGQVLVKITATAFNHRDLWIRRGQYPAIAPGSTFGSDGAGIVVESFQSNDPLLHRRVFLTPMRGWDSHQEAPESRFGILGGGSFPPLGTFTEYIAVERDQVIISPDHLDDVQVSAWPLAGLTAWRAAIVNAQVEKGHTILITGVGGGVALFALQLCVAKGANVYVTSGKQEKIDKALSIGARGGVNYKDKDWPVQLTALMKKNRHCTLDAVIDSAGGDIMGQLGRIIRNGGRVVCYGMTAQPKITFTMRDVLKNQRLIGSTMGSRQDLVDATDFLAARRIVPVVSHVIDGLEKAEEGFTLMKRGDQFGKIVIKLRGRDEGQAKL